MENSWIKSPVYNGGEATVFSSVFSFGNNIKKATLTASAVGVYALYINGGRIGEGILAPGFTSYNKRIQYQTYDVTGILSEKTEIKAEVAPGWAVGFFGLGGKDRNFFEFPAFTLKLIIEYGNGKTEEITTSEKWNVFTSETVFADIYHGETIDKTAESIFLGNAVPTEINSKLIPQEGADIIEAERIAPADIIITPKGERVVDFGVNIAGYVEISVKGERGKKIVIHHGEILDKDGNFYNENYRNARSECVYILSGEKDVFKPRFSFQGFRYIRLTEFPLEAIKPEDFTAVVIHSKMERTGFFKCGNEKINRLYENIIRSQKGNYIDIPTDCPQRDERLGWMGDAQVFLRTGAINFNVEKFFEKWLEDIILTQDEDGAVRGVYPLMPGHETRVSAGWGDAICIIPYELYLAYGHTEILSKCFPAMKKWVEYLRNSGDEELLWLGGYHYGDWLALDAGADSYVGATSNDLIATVFFAVSVSIVVKTGEIVGEDVSEYRELYSGIIKRFREYFTENGMPKEEICEYPEKKSECCIRKGLTQTALTLMLHFDICEKSEKKMLSKILVELINKNGGLMSTGFIGTPYILHALSENGYVKEAYNLLLNEKNPSWLYSVNHGATTIWEHWNGIKEDGSLWSKSMNSFNHYAYGAVYDWIFGVSCGIRTSEKNPGYREVIIEPKPDARLGFAEASIKTANGKIASRWEYSGETILYEFEIPEGVTGYIRLPSGTEKSICEGKYIIKERA